jgi:transcriptional regulator with PAS, ATPase and Fis domain
MAESVRELSRAIGPIQSLPPESLIFGQTEAMRRVRDAVAQLARTPVPVLIAGESGTGKEVIARLLHNWSFGNDSPFIKITCPAMPAQLLEDELFGSERDTSAGGSEMDRGGDEATQFGTLFLDEVAELDLQLQARLLHVVQHGQIWRLTVQRHARIDARVVCTTNRHLDCEVEAGTFRRDLLYRINVATIDLPPLRERRTDIPGLGNYFITLYNTTFNCHAFPLTKDLVELLQKHDWPGNTRELENVMKRYVILGASAIVSALTRVPPSMLAVTDDGPSGPIALRTLTKVTVHDLECKLIMRALESEGGNRRKAARALNISYRALLYKMRDMNLPLVKGRHG